MPATTTTKRRKPDEQPQQPQQPAPARPADQAPVQALAQPQALTQAAAVEVAAAYDADAIAAALAAPFAVDEIKFKPGVVSGSRALALPFVDARVIQDRLDDVLTVMGWQDSYECLPDGSVVCRLKIRIGGEWITKEDVGGQSEQPDEGDRRKAAFSDALKRCAVKFGIGRYLYRQKPTWVDYDAQKRKWTGNLPIITGSVQQQQQVARREKQQQQQQQQRPARSYDEAAERQDALKQQQQQQQTAATPPADWHRKLQEFDQKLAEDGLCRLGELVKCVAINGQHNGYPTDFTSWDQGMVDAAREWTEDFRLRMQLQKEVDSLMAAKGTGPAPVLAKLKTPPGTSVAMLTAEQLQTAIARLKEMPDKKAKAG